MYTCPQTEVKDYPTSSRFLDWNYYTTNQLLFKFLTMLGWYRSDSSKALRVFLLSNFRFHILVTIRKTNVYAIHIMVFRSQFYL